MITERTAIALALLVCATPILGADPNAGKNAFRAHCTLCHSAEPNDNGGAHGPDLYFVLGRRAADNINFTYTQALKNSGLTWDAPTLERFLASPTTVVPGSSMVVSVPRKEDRENIIAYFQALMDGTFKEAPRPTFGPPPGSVADAPPPKGEAEWKKDAPGRVHRIDVAKLPAPFHTASTRNFPRVVPKPPGARLLVPRGFKVDIFAENLQGPRNMRAAPNGDIFLAETQSGRIKVLRPSKDGARAETIETFAQGLLQPFGILLYPAGSEPKWLYIAEVNRVVRYAYNVGATQATSMPEVVIPELSPVAGGHFTRDLALSADGKRLYVSVGSLSNVAEDMSRKSPAEVKAWEAEHGLGAAWDMETNRAAVLAFAMGSNKPGKIFATGIRNCVGLTIQPATGDLWCTTNERDLLGDHLVPDYSTRVKEGGFYGWPWYYMGKYEDPRLQGQRPDLADKAIVPDVLFEAHSAALTLTFYTANKGAAAFPKDYAGDGFAVLHGSWNRASRTGHKVVRLPMKNGVPTGEYIDFMVGFITEDGNAWGRPVGSVVASDGSLLISDDGSNRIYRIAYSR